MTDALHTPVEGLGPFAERTFLGGVLGDFTGTAGIRLPSNTIVSARAESVVRALAAGRAVRARPQGSVCTAGVYVDLGAAPLLDVEFSAEEHDLPPIAGEPLRVADAWVFRVEHWSDLLWANLLALGPHLWSRLASPWALGWAALRAGSVRPERVAGGLVAVGRGSFVHPSATVEFSALGAGCHVGAGAVVRGSLLGEGAVVEELAYVEGAVLGGGARIQRQAMAKYSVLERGARHAGTMQLGVLGAEAEVRHGAALFDQSLGAPVRMWRNGALVEAPRGMIGVCVGPGARLGQGVCVAAGRVIAPGLTVLPEAGSVLVHPEAPAGAARAAIHGGRLVSA